MSYPLTLRFKVLAIARQLSVLGSDGALLMYAKMKAFKLKESITVFADQEQSKPLYHIEADRIIDFAATYNMSDAGGAVLGAIRQQGMRSIWRSRYEILRDGEVAFTVQEENPWAKVADAWFEGIPLIGMLSGYVFHPRYLVSSPQFGDVIRVTKQPAFFETAFSIERLPAALPAQEERLLLIGTVVMVLLERRRG